MYYCFFFQAEDGIRDLVRSRGLGDVYKRQALARLVHRLEGAEAAPYLTIPVLPGQIQRRGGRYGKLDRQFDRGLAVQRQVHLVRQVEFVGQRLQGCEERSRLTGEQAGAVIGIAVATRPDAGPKS